MAAAIHLRRAPIRSRLTPTREVAVVAVAVAEAVAVAVATVVATTTHHVMLCIRLCLADPRL